MIVITACSNRAKKQNQTLNNQIETDSTSLNNESLADSSVVFILSIDGELIQRISYLYDRGEGIRKYRMPEFINYIKGYPTGDTIIGDFNGDGKLEKAWFHEKGYEAYLDCQNNGTKESCEGVIRFSNKNIKELIIDYCPMWTIKNEGDINCDGKDEIGVLPGWFNSSCRSYYVYTLLGNKWIEACPPIGNSLNNW